MVPNVGDRVQMTGIMPNDPCPIEVGTTGTVIGIGDVAYLGNDLLIAAPTQIFVDWDNGRSLILLSSDPFTVIR
jgi:hypothetical protein